MRESKSSVIGADVRDALRRGDLGGMAGWRVWEVDMFSRFCDISRLGNRIRGFAGLCGRWFFVIFYRLDWIGVVCCPGLMGGNGVAFDTAS